MPITIKIDYDKQSLREAQRILRAIPGALPRVLQRGINRTVDFAATDLNRRVRDNINIKAGGVRKSIKKNKASRGNLSGSIAAGLGRPGLLDFKGTRASRRRGVTYRIGDQTTNLPHGFIATMASGHRGVFLRSRFHSRTRGEVRLMQGKKKEAIYELKGPSIWKIITDTTGLLAKAQALAGTRLAKHIDDQIGVELKRWAKRGKR